jgi:hypothetical protein
MDVTGSILQLNTPDGKMEAYEARPKDNVVLCWNRGFDASFWTRRGIGERRLGKSKPFFAQHLK